MRRAHERPTSSPEFADLLDGYRRFRDGGWTPDRERWAAAARRPEPQVMVIACSDSRVDPAQIFDVAPGRDLRRAQRRRAGAAVRDHARATTASRPRSNSRSRCSRCKEIVVMGHGMCGGCKAALTQELHGTRARRRRLHRRLDRHARRGARADRRASSAPRAARPSGRWSWPAVKVSLANLRTFPCIRRKERDGKLQAARRLFRDRRRRAAPAGRGDAASFSPVD